jgi:hypothetical protein
VLIAHFVHTFWDITHFIHTQSYCICTLCELQSTSCEIDPGEIGPGEIGPGEIGPGESAQYAQSVLIAHFVHTFLEYNTLYILYTYFFVSAGFAQCGLSVQSNHTVCSVEVKVYITFPFPIY